MRGTRERNQDRKSHRILCFYWGEETKGLCSRMIIGATDRVEWIEIHAASRPFQRRSLIRKATQYFEAS